MRSIFAPGISLINKLKYPQKFLFISIVLILFISGLLFSMLKDLNEHISFVKKEKIALEYIDPVKNMLQNLQEYRGEINAYLRGYIDSTAPIEIRKKLIEQNIRSFSYIDRKHKYIFNVESDWDYIVSKWNNIKKNSLYLTPEESFEENTELIDRVIELIASIGNKSRLIFDYEKNSFYITYNVVHDLPLIAEKAGNLRGLGVNIAAKRTISDSEKMDLIARKAIFRSRIHNLSKTNDRVFQQNPFLRERLASLTIEIDRLGNALIETINNKIINADIITILPQEFFVIGTNALNSVFRLYEVKIYSLYDLLEKRYANLVYKRFFLILTSLSLLLALVYLFASFSISILDSVHELQNTAIKVAEGNLETQATINTNDELNDLAVSTNQMIRKLNILIQREKILKNLMLKSLKSPKMRETLKVIANTTAKQFEADRCFFLEYINDENCYMRVKKDYSYLSSLEFLGVAGTIFTKEQMGFLTDIIFDQRKVLAVNDVNQIVIPEETRKLLEKYQIKSFMMAPMFYLNNPFGVIVVDSVNEKKEYSREDIELFESIANQSSIIVNQTKLIEEVQTKSNNEALLRKLTNIILTNENLNSALEQVFKEISDLFGVDKVNIRFYNKEDNTFNEVFSEYKLSGYIPTCKGTPPLNKEISEIIIRNVFQDNKILASHFDEKNVFGIESQEFEECFNGAKTILMAPILYKEKPLAVLGLSNTEKKKCWSDKELFMLGTICQQLSLGINLYNFNYELKIALDNEQRIRKIITETTNLNTHEEIEKYLLDELVEIFAVDWAYNLRIEGNKLIVMDQSSGDNEPVQQPGTNFVLEDYLKELAPEEGDILKINNTATDIKDPELKKCLIDNFKINAMLVYPNKKGPKNGEEAEVFEITVLASENIREWKPREKYFFQVNHGYSLSCNLRKNTETAT